MENNNGYILDFIKKRMTDLGYKTFAIDTVTVDVPLFDASITVFANNEYWYLVYPTDTIALKNLRIFSDTEYFETNEKSFTAGGFFTIKEFSGQLELQTSVGAINGLEFIRAIPEEFINADE